MSAVPVFPPPHLVPSDEQPEDARSTEQRENAEPSSSSNAPVGNTSDQNGPHIMGALPAPPPPGSSSAEPGSGQPSTATQIDIAAIPQSSSSTTSTTNTFKFDALGPLVVNSDGTLSRIHNWQSMTESERERTVRVLGKRNQLRIADLKAADDTAGTGTGKKTS